MLKFIKSFFVKKQEVQEPAPYKVETAPVVAVGELPATVVVAEAPVVSAAVEGAGLVEVPAEAPKAKKPRAPKKPAAEKKPRAPRKPKAQK